jgi:hypothetical protein
MRTPGISNDPDTDRLLAIVIWNLERFFGYTGQTAEELVRTSYPKRDDDFYHHEGAFRSAALLHFSAIQEESSSLGDFPMWLRAQNLDDAAREASEYFREHYFTRD